MAARALRDDLFYLPGQLPAIVTAPHAVRQLRDGKPKFAEPATADLVRALHEKMGCYGLIKSKSMGDDANFDPYSGFRDFLVEAVTEEGILFGFDLHQMSSERPWDLILGTGYGKNVGGDTELVDVLVAEIEASEPALDFAVDELFPASNENTVSASVARRAQIPYIQVELNSRLFHSETGGASDFERIQELLERMLREAVAHEQARAVN